ncbi:MAG: hypothetical protein RLY86_3613 [Pseudomonadota bacterium]|jgi:hypothetical protein
MQGNLDGLCGVYSVVNASLHLSRKRLTQDQTKDLFRRLCAQLGEEGRLEDTLFDGMTVRTLGRLIDTSSEFLKEEGCGGIHRKVAFSSAPDGLARFWDAIAAHIKEHGTGSVILGMGGKYDHWTCVGAISENRISLIDSDGLQRISRINCTIADERVGRHHALVPTQTYLLSAIY